MQNCNLPMEAGLIDSSRQMVTKPTELMSVDQSYISLLSKRSIDSAKVEFQSESIIPSDFSFHGSSRRSALNGALISLEPSGAERYTHYLPGVDREYVDRPLTEDSRGLNPNTDDIIGCASNLQHGNFVDMISDNADYLTMMGSTCDDLVSGEYDMDKLLRDPDETQLFQTIVDELLDVEIKSEGTGSEGTRVTNKRKGDGRERDAMDVGGENKSECFVTDLPFSWFAMTTKGEADYKEVIGGHEAIESEGSEGSDANELDNGTSGGDSESETKSEDLLQWFIDVDGASYYDEPCAALSFNMTEGYADVRTYYER